MHKPDGTQQERILAVLRAVQSGEHEIPEQYIRRHPSGDGVSARYFKQVLFISECNGRISELRALGHEIDTSEQKDPYRFVYHRLKPTAAHSPSLESWYESLPVDPHHHG
jgi:hypothetical protein